MELETDYKQKYEELVFDVREINDIVSFFLHDMKIGEIIDSFKGGVNMIQLMSKAPQIIAMFTNGHNKDKMSPYIDKLTALYEKHKALIQIEPHGK